MADYDAQLRHKAWEPKVLEFFEPVPEYCSLEDKAFVEREVKEVQDKTAKALEQAPSVVQGATSILTTAREQTRQQTKAAAANIQPKGSIATSLSLVK